MNYHEIYMREIARQRRFGGIIAGVVAALIIMVGIVGAYAIADLKEKRERCETAGYHAEVIKGGIACWTPDGRRVWVIE